MKRINNKLDKDDSKKEKEVRDRVIFIRATKEEYEQINDLAEYTNMSPSRYLISCGLNQKIKWRKAKKVTDQEREQLEELMWQLKKLGRNVNQLTHSCQDIKLVGMGVIDLRSVLLAGEQIKNLLKQLEERL